MYDLNSGPSNQHSREEEKEISTTNFGGSNAQDEISAADMAAQQSKCSISRISLLCKNDA